MIDKALSKLIKLNILISRIYVLNQYALKIAFFGGRKHVSQKKKLAVRGKLLLISESECQIKTGQTF